MTEHSTFNNAFMLLYVLYIVPVGTMNYECKVMFGHLMCEKHTVVA